MSIYEFGIWFDTGMPGSPPYHIETITAADLTAAKAIVARHYGPAFAVVPVHTVLPSAERQAMLAAQ